MERKPKRVTIKIKTTNEVFENHQAYEVSRILRGIADRLDTMPLSGIDQMALLDSLGGIVGDVDVV